MFLSYLGHHKLSDLFWYVAREHNIFHVTCSPNYTVYYGAAKRETKIGARSRRARLRGNAIASRTNICVGPLEQFQWAGCATFKNSSRITWPLDQSIVIYSVGRGNNNFSARLRRTFWNVLSCPAHLVQVYFTAALLYLLKYSPSSRPDMACFLELPAISGAMGMAY